jgi:hypothetical protein
MRYTTTQLIFRHWYSGVDLPEAAAVKELNDRGWAKPLRAIVLVLVVPFILPERIIVAVDMGDPWENADFPTIAFSAIFSAWMVSPIVFVISSLIAGATWLDGKHAPNWLAPLISGGIFVTSSVIFAIRDWWKKRA